MARNYEMIKTGGMNVAPAEVEEVLRSHEHVDQAYVVAVPDDVRGERVFAFVVPRDDAAATDAGAIASYCRTHLATYKVPTHIEIVGADAVPLTSTGKSDRRRLSELAAARTTALLR